MSFLLAPMSQVGMLSARPFRRCAGTALTHLRTSSDGLVHRSKHCVLPSTSLLSQWVQTHSTAAQPLHPAVADAIVDEANQLLEESRQHWAKGEYEQCAEACRRVAEDLLGDSNAKLQGDHYQLAASAHVNQACALKVLHRHQAALDASEKGLKLLERRFSKHKSEVTKVLDLVAELCLLCGNIEQADQHIARSLQIKEAFPWHAESLAVTWNLKAQAYVQRGNWEGAKQYFGRSLHAHVTNSKGGNLPAAAAVVLSNYANLLKENGKYGEAAQFYGKAMDVLEAQLGPDNEAVGRTLVELGAMYVLAGHKKHAVEPLTRAMVVLSTALGADHPAVLATMSWLGKCRGSQDQVDDQGGETLHAPGGCPVERLLAETSKS